MPVYIGPTIYGTPEPDTDEPSNVISVVGNLDMKQFQIINLRQSGRDRSDAATVGYVSDWIGRINNNKVDWRGGTMTGDLNMGTHKLKQPGNPEDEEDVINKRYFDRIVQHTKPYDIGRYIVFPHADGTETFHGAGSRRNIDLDSDKVFEIFNNNVHNPQHIAPFQSNPGFSSTPVPVQGKEKVMFLLNKPHPISLANVNIDPWTVMFSVQTHYPPENTPHTFLHFGDRRNSNEHHNIQISWGSNTFTYQIDRQDPTTIKIDTTKTNHFALRYSNNTLDFWVNGVSKKTHKLTLTNFREVALLQNVYGVVSIYNRALSKLEIVEHYIKYHIKPFTDNEVLS